MGLWAKGDFIMNTHTKRAVVATGLAVVATGAALPVVGVESASAATVRCGPAFGVHTGEFVIQNGSQWDCCTGSGGWLHVHV